MLLIFKLSFQVLSQIVHFLEKKLVCDWTGEDGIRALNKQSILCRSSGRIELSRIELSPDTEILFCSLNKMLKIVALKKHFFLFPLPPHPPLFSTSPSRSVQSGSSTAPMEIAYVWARWSATSWITVETTVMRRTALWSPSILHQASSTVSTSESPLDLFIMHSIQPAVLFSLLFISALFFFLFLLSFIPENFLSIPTECE